MVLHYVSDYFNEFLGFQAALFCRKSIGSLKKRSGCLINYLN
ncbi:hypothetical protein [Alysiella crassa]|nr:hypothetical protein [Alysiella crassa]